MTSRKAAATKDTTPAVVQAAIVQAVVPDAALTDAPVVLVAAKNAPAKAAKSAKDGFQVQDFVVYPTHGVGRITGEEQTEIAGMPLRMYVISFPKDKMTLRVPVHRAVAAGLRPVSGKAQLEKAFITLKGRAKTGRGMWSRRAQEYETKINSGDILALAEVVRDLHKNVDQAERSYSERVIYESALERLAAEVGASEGIATEAATAKVVDILGKAKKRAAAKAAEVAAEAANVTALPVHPLHDDADFDAVEEDEDDVREAA